VGQGTETTCSGVRSFFFIRTRYSKTRRKIRPIGNNTVEVWVFDLESGNERKLLSFTIEQDGHPGSM
jgi:hypothetical protein